MNDGAWYAFSAPNGLTCVLGPPIGRLWLQRADTRGAGRRQHGERGARRWARLRQFRPSVVRHTPWVQSTLPPNTRLSFRTVSCGTDGVATSCTNSADQTGFVLSPAGSFVFGA